MTASIDLQRHAMIEHAVLVLRQRGESSLTLWTCMAAALGKVIGPLGFESLFFRSLYELETRHPWLAADRRADTGSIDHLSALLATRDIEESEKVSTALLIVFADTLNLLIGELVTNRILLSAWGKLAIDDASEPTK